MHIIKRYIISVFLLLIVIVSHAQDLTGTWEGELGTSQFLRLNIIQNGDKICGFSTDTVVNEDKDFCKATFEATYDKTLDKWIFRGTSFIDNTGDHTLMKMELKYERIRKKDILRGLETSQIYFPNFFDDRKYEFIYLKRISNYPLYIIDEMQECYQKKRQIFGASKLITPKKKNQVDSTALSKIEINPRNKITTTLKSIALRKNTEQSRIEIKEKHIKLKVYDNAIIDGDTISIFYNNKLLLGKQLLTEKGVEIDVEIDETQSKHEIILFAHNLGSIPPNTALIVVYVGKNRYELFASASLDENAVLVFDYKPK